MDPTWERSTGRNQWIELTLTEGKNREVRRVLEHLGPEVSRLLRRPTARSSCSPAARRGGGDPPGRCGALPQGPENPRQPRLRVPPRRTGRGRASSAPGPIAAPTSVRRWPVGRWERAPVARTPMASAPAGRLGKQGQALCRQAGERARRCPPNDGSRTGRARRPAPRWRTGRSPRAFRPAPFRPGPIRPAPLRRTGKGPRRPVPRK